MSYQFFVNESQIWDKTIRIEGDDVFHIKNVLRMRVGEELSVVVSDKAAEYRCAIKEFMDDAVECELLFVKESDVELKNKIYLFQALPKQDKMELIIQKAVELGVYEIIPVATKRAVVKLDGAKEAKKIDRWNAISEAAAKQSKRRIVPRVNNVMTFKEAVEYAGGSLIDEEGNGNDCSVKVIPYELCSMDAMEETRKILSSVKEGESVAVFIGPEGGFTEEEIIIAKESGIIPITLGRRILRTETAGFVVLSWLNYLLEE